METPHGRPAMRRVGGNLALDFVNTQRGPARGPPNTEGVADYLELLSWGCEAGIIVPAEANRLAREAGKHPATAAAAHRLALSVRANLYEIFSALARLQQPPEAALRSLRDDEAHAIEHAELRLGVRGFRWDWAGSGDLAMPLWPIVHAAAQLLTRSPLRRLKACPACRVLFLDQSRNGSRRWCSMEDCGKAEKMRRYVARRAARRGPDRATPTPDAAAAS